MIDPAAALGALPSTGLRPGPDEARSWLERELARPDYRRSLLERFTSWVGDLWDRLTGTALSATPLSTGVALVLAVVLAVLLVLAVSRVRRDPVGPTREDGLLSGPTIGPDGHRSAALSALGREAASEALVEAFRALAVRSVQRGLVEARPGITAHELVSALAPRFPDHTERLHRAADRFDAAFYGRQPVVPDDAQAVLDLDDELGTASTDPPRRVRGRAVNAVLRRNRPAVALTVLVLVTLVVLSALTLRAAPRGDDLDPDNPAGNGAQAVARVLVQQGVEVEVARGAAQLEAAGVDAGTTVLVTSTTRLGRETARDLGRLARLAGGLVVTTPGPAAVQGLRLPVTPAAGGLERVLTATCDDPLLEGLRLEPGPTRAYRPIGAAADTVTACFSSPPPRPASLVLRVDADPTTYVVASDGVLSNDAVTDQDNAAAALRLLGQHPRLVWYIADADDIAPGDTGSFAAQLPAGLLPGVWLAFAALLATMLWRGRRLGPLVTEPLPVVVKAVESTQGRGRLYRRVRDRDHVARVLRRASARRLATDLRLPRGTDPADLVLAAADRTGRDPHDLHDLLVTRRVDDDAALTHLADDLARLEKEVHHP